MTYSLIRYIYSTGCLYKWNSFISQSKWEGKDVDFYVEDHSRVWFYQCILSFLKLVLFFLSLKA